MARYFSQDGDQQRANPQHHAQHRRPEGNSRRTHHQQGERREEKEKPRKDHDKRNAPIIAGMVGHKLVGIYVVKERIGDLLRRPDDATIVDAQEGQEQQEHMSTGHRGTGVSPRWGARQESSRRGQLAGPDEMVSRARTHAFGHQA